MRHFNLYDNPTELKQINSNEIETLLSQMADFSVFILFNF